MRSSLGKYWPVVIDLETSGVVFDKHAILEVAAAPLEYSEANGWSYSEVWHEHIEPFADAEYSAKAMAVHGIDVDHPFRQAISEQDWLQSWKSKLDTVAKNNGCRRCMLVGHNAHFDLNFIMAAVNRCQINIPLHSFICFDTATIGAYLYGETALPKLLRKVGIKYRSDAAHSAIYDVEVTAKMIAKVLGRV